MYPESKSSDSSRETSKIQYYKCQVRGSFCDISEEYAYLPTIPDFPGLHRKYKLCPGVPIFFVENPGF